MGNLPKFKVPNQPVKTEGNSNNIKEVRKMGITSMVGKRITKKVKFMNEDITISKLSVAEVMAIQASAKSVEKDETQGFEVLKTVIRSSAEDADKLSDGDFDGFPMDELSKLSNEIMKFSGIGQDAGK